MLKIENYKKLIGLKFGEWHCGLAEEHDTLYRFHFREGDNPNLGWKKTYWIELGRIFYIDADGDEVYPLHHPNRKVTTIISKRYIKDMDKVYNFFNQIVREYGTK